MRISLRIVSPAFLVDFRMYLVRKSARTVRCKHSPTNLVSKNVSIALRDSPRQRWGRPSARSVRLGSTGMTVPIVWLANIEEQTPRNPHARRVQQVIPKAPTDLLCV